MISAPSYGAGFRELAWPLLGATAVALLVSPLLWSLHVKLWQERALPEQENTPEACGRTKEPHDFTYDSLPQSSEAASHAIRLLRIHYDNSDTHLSCSLDTFNFDTCHDYWALSYTWGPETPSHIILVNGKGFRVRQNLFDFIAAFRSPYNAEFYLWIDQICINQENIPERNSQVRRMGQYYDRATKVITWLGIGTELELAALAHIQQVDIDNGPPAKSKQPMTLDLLRGYRSIMTNSYFERLWIVQEMARAKGIMVILGTDTSAPMTTTWRHFNFAFVQIMFERTIISTTSETAQQEMSLRQEIRDRCDILLQLLEVKKHQDSTDIFQLIEAFSDRKCADPRDKLYALQDIGNLQKQLFTIDYSKSKYQVYFDFFTTCLNSAKPGYTWSEHQFDVLLRLGKTMGIRVEVQTDSAGHASGSDEGNAQAKDTKIVLSTESFGKLRESIDYGDDPNVLIFGPRYDKETGHHVSPLSKESSRGRIPTVFHVPASLDLEEMSRTAMQDLSRRMGVDLDGQLLASDRRGANAVDESSTSNGYRTITYLTGDISHWGLPPSDTDE